MDIQEFVKAKHAARVITARLGEPKFQLEDTVENEGYSSIERTLSLEFRLFSSSPNITVLRLFDSPY